MIWADRNVEHWIIKSKLIFEQSSNFGLKTLQQSEYFDSKGVLAVKKVFRQNTIA